MARTSPKQLPWLVRAGLGIVTLLGAIAIMWLMMGVLSDDESPPQTVEELYRALIGEALWTLFYLGVLARAPFSQLRSVRRYSRPPMRIPAKVASFVIRSLAVVSVLLMLIRLCFIVVSFFESTVESAWAVHELGEEWRVRGFLVWGSSWLAAAAWHWLAWNRVMKTGGIEAFDWGNRGA